MGKENKQDNDFNAVKTAFVGKYGKEYPRMVKDLNNLIKMREVQCFARCQYVILNAAYIATAQIPLIKDTFKQWMK
jgi:hypothetical protein